MNIYTAVSAVLAPEPEIPQDALRTGLLRQLGRIEQLAVRTAPTTGHNQPELLFQLSHCKQIMPCAHHRVVPRQREQSKNILALRNGEFAYRRYAARRVFKLGGRLL